MACNNISSLHSLRLLACLASLSACRACSPHLGSIGGGASSSAAGASAPPIQAKHLKADWENFIDDIAKSICEEQSPQR
jgi:hypothetical protein